MFDGTNESTVVIEADKEEKKESVVENAAVKPETFKSSSILQANMSSIHEPLLKIESKDEDMIHDSDFEEPSGISIDMKCSSFKLLTDGHIFTRPRGCSFPKSLTS